MKGVCLFAHPTGYRKSERCRLLWNMNLVEIARAHIIVSALVAILSSSSSVSKDNIGTEEIPLQRQLVFLCTRSCYNC